MIKEFLLHPKDIIKALRKLSLSNNIGIFGGIALFIVAFLIFGFDLAFLLAGLFAMIVGKISFRVPLVFAIIGLVILMFMSFIVEDGNSWESVSASIAVLVFFMMLFGVAKMTYDQVVDGIQSRKPLDKLALPASQEELRKPAQPKPQPVTASATQPQQAQPARQPIPELPLAIPSKRPQASQPSMKPRQARPVRPIRHATKPPTQHIPKKLAPTQPQPRSAHPKRPIQSMDGMAPVRRKKPTAPAITTKPKQKKPKRRLIQG